MDESLALRLLGRIMKWPEDVATREYKWVRLMANLKYDGYGDYVAGVRFAESLAGWLVQFEDEDRQTAYDFVKNRLIYFSVAEVNRLVTELQPRYVEPILRAAAGAATGVPEYMAAVDPKASKELEILRRQTLYIGLSDGARIDILRRANAGVLVNDQIVLATHIDSDKWDDLQGNLTKDLAKLGSTDAKFKNIFLIDDFTGSGTTFIRPKDTGWTGKLYKFAKATRERRQSFTDQGKPFPLTDDTAIYVHHYISTTKARETILERLKAIRTSIPIWFDNVEVSEGVLLPEDTPLDPTRDTAMWALTDKYYDPAIWEQLKDHLDKSQKDLKRGYADCALPIVLEHNCPNNSIALLWAETEGENGMRPLFPRRHRHS